MSENTNNEENMLANLAQGEPVIPKEYIEKNKEVVDDLVNKYKELSKPQIEKISEKVEESKAIVAPEPKDEKPGLGYLAGGIMGSTTVPAPVEKKIPTNAKKVVKKDTVAVYSTRNVTWNGVGKVYIGYNIVSPESAKQWETRDHIRIATPEEVAREYGK